MTFFSPKKRLVTHLQTYSGVIGGFCKLRHVLRPSFPQAVRERLLFRCSGELFPRFRFWTEIFILPVRLWEETEVPGENPHTTGESKLSPTWKLSLGFLLLWGGSVSHWGCNSLVTFTLSRYKIIVNLWLLVFRAKAVVLYRLQWSWTARLQWNTNNTRRRVKEFRWVSVFYFIINFVILDKICIWQDYIIPQTSRYLIIISYHIVGDWYHHQFIIFSSTGNLKHGANNTNYSILTAISD